MNIRKLVPAFGVLALVAGIWAAPAFAGAGGTQKHANAVSYLQQNPAAGPCHSPALGGSVGTVTLNQPTSANADHNISVDINVTNATDNTYYVWLGWASSPDTNCTWYEFLTTMTVIDGVGTFQGSTTVPTGTYYFVVTLTTDAAGAINEYSTAPQTQLTINN